MGLPRKPFSSKKEQSAARPPARGDSQVSWDFGGDEELRFAPSPGRSRGAEPRPASTTDPSPLPANSGIAPEPANPYWVGSEEAFGDVYDYGRPVSTDDAPSTIATTFSHRSNAPAAVTAGGSALPAGASPQIGGTQRGLEEALVNWWSDGRLPTPALLRNGLLMLEAGIDIEESHRSLLLRTALYYQRGMVTALKHQSDPERTALVMREAVLDPARPLGGADLTRLIKEDPGSPLWVPNLEDELAMAVLSPDPIRSELANQALDQLDAATQKQPMTALLTHHIEESWRQWVPRIGALALFIALAVVVALAIGWLVNTQIAPARVRIPNGNFAVFNQDGTSRVVSIPAFEIAPFEVTNGQYQRCVQRGRCPELANGASVTRATYRADPAFADYPVIHVSQAAAQSYCAWEGGRLPTEDEWQVAASYSFPLARAYHYPWGDRYVTGLANSGDAPTGDTLAVGQYHPAGDSWYGLSDMAGNVAEWTQTAGPAASGAFVVKGGSFLDDASGVRGEARQLVDAGTAAAWLGFRCVSGASLRN